MSSLTPRWRTVLDAASTILLIVASTVILVVVFLDRYGPRPVDAVHGVRPAPVPTEPLSLEGATLLGDKNAKVAVIEYSDFECPFCGKFAEEIRPVLQREYVDTGKVLLAFRHFPLSIHRLAEGAAMAAECAGRQNRFWEMHARLFADRSRLDLASLREHAQALRLGLEAFDTCMSGEVAEKVRADVDSARKLSIAGTPTFLVGTIEADGRVRVVTRLNGARSMQELRHALDDLLPKDVQ
jgi:protein-disulfide isomerase